jgi:hypothetical protein
MLHESLKLRLKERKKHINPPYITFKGIWNSTQSSRYSKPTTIDHMTSQGFCHPTEQKLRGIICLSKIRTEHTVRKADKEFIIIQSTFQNNQFYSNIVHSIQKKILIKQENSRI